MQQVVVSCLAAMWFAGMAASAQEAVTDDLVVNGSFEVNAGGWADGWDKRPGCEIRREEGNSWLLLKGSYRSSSQRINLKPEWWHLRLNMRMRVTDVEVGDEGWKDARLAMSFHAEDGTRVGNWPNVFHARGTTEWVDCERVYPVPRGAAYLVLNPANFGTTGTAEFDSIRLVVIRERAAEKTDAPAPEGIGNPWDMERAWREKTETRERFCLNGLWRFRPVVTASDADAVPAEGDCWGWFKVPGIWPSTHWTLGNAAQDMVIASWLDEGFPLAGLEQGWYKREVGIPREWAGKRIGLDFTMLQTHATVYVDGKAAGEVWFPGGRLDLTDALQPGQRHSLAIMVTAKPLSRERRDFMAPDRIIESKAVVKLKGITGDLFLDAAPREARITDVRIDTSYRERRIAFDVGVAAGERRHVRLEAAIRENGREVLRAGPAAARVVDGRAVLAADWADPKLWDTDTPRNRYRAMVGLLDTDGFLLDQFLPIEFGFREFWIEGRDFMLNGRRIHLRALHNVSLNAFADQACRERAEATCGRMQEYGFNFLITGNYNFTPGEVGYIDGLMEAADRTGMLMSFSLPHVKDFQWKLDDSGCRERYRTLTEWLIRRVCNHPGVVLYAMNHNATGYYGDQNPLKMDGIYAPDPLWRESGENPSAVKRREQALMAAEIATQLDPTRPVYHHQSGNLGSMHTVNIYLNWAPRQERSDWLAHWAEAGCKPMFFVEWGLPHISSWSSYRGPRFIWRCEAFQSIWDSEFAAPVVGETAYEMTPEKVKLLEVEDDFWAAGKPFRWGSFSHYLRGIEKNHIEIQAHFANDNWRFHRAHGVSSMLPWDQGEIWVRTKPTKAIANAARYAKLQQPGIVPDRFNAGSQYIYDPGDRGNFEPTSLGRSFRRWNQAHCGFIGGDLADSFTEKSHTTCPRSTVCKSLILLNDTRRQSSCVYQWSFTAGEYHVSDGGTVVIPAGGRLRVPVVFPAPDVAPTEGILAAECAFDGAPVQHDSFRIHVLPAIGKMSRLTRRICLYDPHGMTGRMLTGLGISFTVVGADADLAPGDVLIVGREALSDAPALPWTRLVAEGLRVIVFEQTAEALTERLGFRVNVHGMRRVFRRIPSHPVLDGLADAHLADWAGSAGLTSPALDLPPIESHNPTWTWCGFRNTRVWRCGNRGNVASVLIEKPPVGNWAPIVDCGFDLQYAPLLEYREGSGLIVFCQLDVTGRSLSDVVTQHVVRNLVAYADSAPGRKRRDVYYAGDAEGRSLLASLGVPFAELGAGSADADSLVVVGGDGAVPPAGVHDALASGARFLGLGMGSEAIRSWLDRDLECAVESRYSRLVDDLSAKELMGVSNSDLHWRTRVEAPFFPTSTRGESPALRVLSIGSGRAVLLQTPPWVFDAQAKPYLRTTRRRSVFLVSRLLANLGAGFGTPLAGRLANPAGPTEVRLPAEWVGIEDPDDKGRDAGWWQAGFDDSSWQAIDVPGAFDEQRKHLAEYNGLFWYRLRFRVPGDLPLDDVTLHVGAVDDESWVWLNGRFLGETTKESRPDDYWSFPREFRVTPDMLLPDDENVLVVRVRDTYLTGGIQGTPMLQRPGAWLRSYYVQVPIAGDDPYRYYRW